MRKLRCLNCGWEYGIYIQNYGIETLTNEPYAIRSKMYEHVLENHLLSQENKPEDVIEFKYVDAGETRKCKICDGIFRAKEMDQIAMSFSSNEDVVLAYICNGCKDRLTRNGEMRV